MKFKPKKSTKINEFKRSSKHSPKFTNSGKLSSLKLLSFEYRRIASLIITDLFENGFNSSDYNLTKETIFNIKKENYNLPNQFPMDFAYRFQDKTFLSITLINKLSNHVLGLVNGTIEKYLFDYKFLENQINFLLDRNDSPKSRNGRKLEKYLKRFNELKLNTPSTKGIPLRFEGNRLDLFINNEEIYNEVLTDKETGESKENLKFIRFNSLNTENKYFDLFIKLRSVLPQKREEFTENLNKLKKDKEFVKTYKYIYLKIEGKSIKFLDLTTEEIYKQLKAIKIPVKSTKIFNKWNSLGKLSQFCEIFPEKNELKFSFDVKIVKKEEGIIVGGDQGFKNVLTLSDSKGIFTQQTKKFNELKENKIKDVSKLSKNARKRERRKLRNHSLEGICEKLVKVKKGTKRFKKLQDYRKNLINQQINELDYSHIKEIRYERVKDLRLGKKQKIKKMIHWSYPLIKKKIVSICESQGLRFMEVTNFFRSQRCNLCGWVQRENRVQESFKCLSCSHKDHADINASRNLSLDLHNFSDSDWKKLKGMKLVCTKAKSRFGFFWFPDRFQFKDIGLLQKVGN